MLALQCQNDNKNDLKLRRGGECKDFTDANNGGK